MFTLPKYSAVISGEVPVETLGITGMLELKEELDEVRENFAAHMLLAICPDVNTNVLNFVGRDSAPSLLQKLWSTSSAILLRPLRTPLPLFLLRLLLLRQQCMAPNLNKKSTSNKTRICYVCGQKHMLFNVQH